jgi:sulfur relay (sulfurtransferase) complex TusBCD TusD component (DsrE family)
MLTVATCGPDAPNDAILPFVTLNGSVKAAEEQAYPDERPEMFLMQEAVYLASQATDLHEIKGTGLPPVGEVLEGLKSYDIRMIACVPCAEARGITSEVQLIEPAEFGTGKDLAKMTQQHDQVLTF